MCVSVCVYMYVCGRQCISPWIYLCSGVLMHLHTCHVCMSLTLSESLCFSLSLSMYACVCRYVFVCMFVCLSECLCVCLYVCVSVCLVVPPALYYQTVNQSSILCVLLNCLVL